MNFATTSPVHVIWHATILRYCFPFQCSCTNLPFCLFTSFPAIHQSRNFPHALDSLSLTNKKYLFFWKKNMYKKIKRKKSNRTYLNLIYEKKHITNEALFHCPTPTISLIPFRHQHPHLCRLCICATSCLLRHYLTVFVNLFWGNIQNPTREYAFPRSVSKLPSISIAFLP